LPAYNVHHTQISLPTSWTMFIFLMQSPYMYWPSSRSYKFDQSVQCKWQFVIADWQTTHTHTHTHTHNII